MQYIAIIVISVIIVEACVRLSYFIRNVSVEFIPLPYVIGHNYGPVPPWLDDLRILKPDTSLIWKSTANLQRNYVDVFSPAHSQEKRLSFLRAFRPALPVTLINNPVWDISLNSDGFRDKEFTKDKTPSVFRIVCLGDSWTFGANVSQEQAFPQQLELLLRQKIPGADFEVLNMGVLGYSSYQGLVLFRERVIDLNPDLIVVSFAMNDASIAGYRDKDMPAHKKKKSLLKKVGNILEKSEAYKLMRYLALILKSHPETLREQISKVAESASRPKEALDYRNLEPWTRVSPWDYEKNIREILTLAKSRGISLILLYNQLSKDAGEVAGIGQVGMDSPYRKVLEEMSTGEGVPLVDSSTLIVESKKHIASELEKRLGLQPQKSHRTGIKDEIEVVFRVYMEDRAVPESVYIVGQHPKLGSLVPNKVAMYDNGTQGDQKPGDNVWSYSVTVKRGTKLFYVYTNSGEAGKWEGLDVPYIRSYKVTDKQDSNKIYLPVETFGRIYMQADGWHTNSYGYKLIAEAVLNKLQLNNKVNSYLAQIRSN